MKENKGAPKNKWSSIYRKKWFFPAVYILVAALLLSAVLWFQNSDNQLSKSDQDEKTGDVYTPNLHGEDAEAVIDQQEVIKMPVKDEIQTEIVTKFFDYDADEKEQADALVLYNSRYYQSTGIDITAENDEAFDVVASLSGTVTEVKEDPLLGNVVMLDHGNNVSTYYASLGEIKVKAGDKVKQGKLLGVAGKNLFGKDHGTHVHFELRKDGKEVNPENYFNQPVSKLEFNDDDDGDDESDNEKANESEKDENNPETDKEEQKINPDVEDKNE